MQRQVLLHPHGSSPLAAWDVVGNPKKVQNATHGFVLSCPDSSPPTRLTHPPASAPPLGLRHQYLVVEVRMNPSKPFAIEIGVRDTFRVKRKLILSAGCKAPELARGGAAKAKLPLISQRPGESSERVTEAGWRLAVLDLDVLIRHAFDGAPYAFLDSVALVGVCLARSVAAAPAPPQVLPPGPVRLVPIFRPAADFLPASMPGTTAAATAATASDDDGVSFKAALAAAGASAYLRKEETEAREKAAAAAADADSRAAARAAEQEFLVEARRQAPPVSEEPIGFIPAGHAVDALAAAAPSAMPARLQAAVRRLGMLGAVASAPHRPRRHGDPRDHATLLDGGGGGDGDAAAIFARVSVGSRGGGSKVADTVLRKRDAMAAAQALACRLRLGTAGEAADLSGLPIGDKGARLLSFVLPRARSLSELRLAGCGLGDSGATYVAAALRMMSTVRVLDLRSSAIGASGGESVAAALAAGCPGLRCLLLGGNELGGRGVGALVRAMAGTASLARLDLERVGATRGQQPLLRDGDVLTLREGKLIHQRMGRQLARTDGAPASAFDRQEVTLHGVKAEIGQPIDLRACGLPALPVACENVGTNGVLEALCAALAQPLPCLQTLYLGGNHFGAPSRDAVSRATARGPNATRLDVRWAVGSDPLDEDATAVAAVATAAVGEATAAREEQIARGDVDEGLALAASAKRWTIGGGGGDGGGGGGRSVGARRPGTCAPEPSLVHSFASTRRSDGDAGACADGAEGPTSENDTDSYTSLDAQGDAAMRHEVRAATFAESKLQPSQTMSMTQSVFFALTGGRVDALAKPVGAKFA